MPTTRCDKTVPFDIELATFEMLCLPQPADLLAAAVHSGDAQLLLEEHLNAAKPRNSDSTVAIELKT